MADDFLRDLSIQLDLEADDSGIRKIMEMNRKMNAMTRATKMFDHQWQRAMKTMPDHLQPVAKSLRDTDMEFRNLRRNAVYSMEDMQQSVLKTRVGFDKLTSVSKTGKEATQFLMDFSKQAKMAQLAALGFNEDASRTLAPAEAAKRLDIYNKELQKTRGHLEELRKQGDFGSYNEGMRLLQQRTREVQQAMIGAARGGEQYMNVLKRLGIETEATGNAAALALERNRDQFFLNNARLQKRTTQSQKIMEQMARMNPFYSASKGAVEYTKHLETVAKQGTAANLAIKILGENASMKDLMDVTRMINMGLMRMQMLTIGVGIAWAASTYVLAKAALGPDPAEIRQQQDLVTQAYTDAFNERYNEIRNFAGLFEKVTSNFVNPATLQKNLSHQVDILRNWTRNMQSLASRGIDEGLVQELQKMGPAAAGEIAALNKMTDTELNKYVATWREKNALARTQAMSELDKLRQQTQKQVQALADSLTPLGESWERFKGVWGEAIAPFIELFGQVASLLVNAGTAVGQFFNYLNSLDPVITKLIGSFLYLTLTFTLLLAPLAVGIGLTGGLAASFSALWMVISPFVIGLATVIGVAVAIAAAIVAVGAAIYFAYKYIEPFRNAVNAAFESVKEFFNGILNQIKVFWAQNGPMVMQALQNIANFFLAIFNFLKPAFAVIWNFFIIIMTNTWNAIKGIVTAGVNIILNILALAGAIFTGNWSAAWTAVKNILWNAILIVWNLLKVSFAGQVIAILLTLKSQIVGVLTAIKNFFVMIWNATVSFVKALLNGFIAFHVFVFTQIYNGIKEKMTAAKNAIVAIWNAVKTFFESIDLYQIGVNILQGLINGITAMAGKVKDTVSSIASSVAETFTGFMDMHSPSRRFKMYGVHTIEGYNEGLQQMQPTTVKQMTNLGSAISQPMQSYAEETPGRLAPASTTTNNSNMNMPKVEININGNVEESMLPNIESAVENGIASAIRNVINRNPSYLEG